jgi:hypothetical protein
MFANMHSEIDLRQGIPTLESFKNNFEDFTIKIHLESTELISLFKNYIRINLDIDLDMLDVFIILDTKGKKFVLNTDELEENDKAELIFLIDEFKHHFGKSIFEFRRIINTQTLFRRLISGYDNYNWNQDGSIDIEYSLYNITESELNKYLNIEGEC